MLTEDIVNVMELGRVLGALSVAGIKAEWVEGEMLEKIAPHEGVELLMEQRDAALRREAKLERMLRLALGLLRRSHE